MGTRSKRGRITDFGEVCAGELIYTLTEITNVRHYSDKGGQGGQPNMLNSKY